VRGRGRQQKRKIAQGKKNTKKNKKEKKGRKEIEKKIMQKLKTIFMQGGKTFLHHWGDKSPPPTSSLF